MDYKDKSPQNLASSWPSCRISLGACMLNHFSHVWLSEILWTVTCQAPLSMGFSRQEYWSGLPCPPPGAPPNWGIKPAFPVSPALQAASLPLSHHAHKAVVFPTHSVWVFPGTVVSAWIMLSFLLPKLISALPLNLYFKGHLSEKIFLWLSLNFWSLSLTSLTFCVLQALYRFQPLLQFHFLMDINNCWI